MTLSRAEAQAKTRPIRENILQVANYLQVAHGVRPEARDQTDPASMDDKTLKRWSGVYGLELRGENGELFTRDELVANAEDRQQNPPGLPDDAAPLDKVQAAYDELKAAQRAILDDLAEDADDVATGPAQTVVPKSISVDALSGMTKAVEA